MKNQWPELQCDITRLLRRSRDGVGHTGIDRVNLHYAKRILNAGGGLSVWNGRKIRVLAQNHAKEVLAGLRIHQKSGPSPLAKSGNIGLRFLKLFNTYCSLPPQATIVNSSHVWLEREEAWAWLMKRGNRVVTFIHDLIPIEFPEYARPIDKTRHMRRIHNTLRYSRGIIVNSQYTETSLISYAGKCNLPPPPICVAPIGHTNGPASTKLPPGIQSPYFLILGTIEPRKNHLILLTVWRELVIRMGSATPMLVVVGRRGWECEQAVDLLDRCEAIRPYVKELNGATDEEVSGLIRGACALLLPSFAEGFGMPVQEALASGTPVIATPLPTFFEMAGEIPEYVEPFDGIRWLHLIMEYASPDSLLRENQIKRIRNFKEITWDFHFERFAAFLKSLP